MPLISAPIFSNYILILPRRVTRKITLFDCGCNKCAVLPNCNKFVKCVQHPCCIDKVSLRIFVDEGNADTVIKITRNLIWVFLMLWLTSACGAISIKIEPVVKTTPTVFPTLVAYATLTLPPPSVATETPEPTNTVRITPSAIVKHFIAAGTPVKLVYLHMIDADKGWATGIVESDLVQHILQTKDGGYSWSDRTPAQIYAMGGIGKISVETYFASISEAWAVFSPENPALDGVNSLTFWHTTDGGNSWYASQQVDLSDLKMEHAIPAGMKFLNSQFGWVTIHLGVATGHDYIAILTTQDGGKIWKRVADPSTNEAIMACAKTGLVFANVRTGWLVGNCPGLMPALFFYRTDDGGQHWFLSSLPAPTGKPDDYFSKTDVIGCGVDRIDYSSVRTIMFTLLCHNYENNTYQAWLYRTDDIGESWDRSLLPLITSHSSFSSSQSGFVLGSSSLDGMPGGVFFQTIDGGKDWTAVTPTGWTGLPDFVDDLNGWVIAEQDQVEAYVRTSDGGKTWSQIKPVMGD
jgi:photosystem II stability/assembly factor-like uncharacterized protein